MSRVAARPRRSKECHAERLDAEIFGREEKRREASAARAKSRMSRMAQNEAIQLNQVCSTSAISVNRKFCQGSRPLEKAWEMLTQRCSKAAGRR